MTIFAGAVDVLVVGARWTCLLEERRVSDVGVGEGWEGAYRPSAFIVSRDGPSSSESEESAASCGGAGMDGGGRFAEPGWASGVTLVVTGSMLVDSVVSCDGECSCSLSCRIFLKHR